MIKIYTQANCPKCKVLKQKLSTKGVNYTEISDPQTLLALGIDFLPVLQIDSGSLLNYKQAIDYVNSLEEP